MQYSFDFNGKSSLTQEIYVEKRPDIPVAKEKVEYISIPGRSEKLCRHTGEFENVEIKVECGFKANQEKWHEKVCAIREWLQGSGELSFQDSEALFWKVCAVKIDGIERKLKKYGFFKVVFTCSPFIRLKEGKKWKSAEEAMKNPGTACHPVYKIEGEGVCILKVNEKSLAVNVGQNVIVDTERMLAYKNDGTMQNTKVMGDYDALWLKKGNNTFQATPGFKVSVMPNWRYI